MLDEEQGIKAIIALQAVGGDQETEEQAKEGWNRMSDTEKVSTEIAHRMVCGGFGNG
jgi:hypothetical protein